MTDNSALTRETLRAPRAGAIAGIVFSLLFITSLAIMRLSVPANPVDSGRWLQNDSEAVQFALNLLPFAGLAFLWFIGVLRDRLGAREDKFFATVFFGSGLLFIALLLVAAAVAGGIITLHHAMPGKLAESGLYTYGRTVTHQIITGYAMKMAAAFMISTCTLSVHTAIFPRWIALIGYTLAVLLLVGSSLFFWASVLFPLWVLLLSVHILVANMQRHPAHEDSGSREQRGTAQ